MYTEALDMSNQQDANYRTQWRPRENVLVTSLWEHKKAVNRLAVSRDQSFFASASSDKTVKIWQLNSLDEASFLKSSITYEEHKNPVSDLCIVENTHTIASASMDGTIHLWRVDLVKQRISAANGMTAASENRHQSQQVNVFGSTILRTTNVDEGQLLNVYHFNSDSASILLYTTQKGFIHAWDLRSSVEPFVITVRPELGTPTCLALAPDRCWIMVGTSRGYIGLWDIRYNVLSKLWRHSSNAPIHRMACCKPIPKSRSDIMQFTNGSYLFVAAGNNEAAVWGIPEGGECFKCFRSVPMAEAYRKIESLPVLEHIPLTSHPNGVITHALATLRPGISHSRIDSTHSVRAIMGRISHTGLSYLVTAGTDKNIRFWDFMAPNRCLTVSGLNQTQPKGCYETPSMGGFHGKLFMCLDSNVPSADTVLKAQMPLREGRGPLPVVSTYKDSILDLKSIDLPARMILSCGRDGDIKLWR
jgi:phosphoinositide-3-kinase regulatory subunit 4